MALRLDKVVRTFGTRAVLFNVRELRVFFAWEDCGDFGVLLPLMTWFWGFYEWLLAVTLHQSSYLLIESVVGSLRFGSAVALLGASNWASRSSPSSMALAQAWVALTAVVATKLDVMPVCGYCLALGWSLLCFTSLSGTSRWFYFHDTIYGSLFTFFIYRTLFIYRSPYLMTSWLCWALR